MAITLEGKLYVCVQATHMTPGNLRAFVQAKLRSPIDGTIIDKRLRSVDEIEQAYLDRRQMEYLYSDNTGHILMDSQTYDQITASDELIGEAIKFVKPNTSLTALTHEGNVISIELPKSVDLAVTETTPTPKGATVMNQLKEAVLETGLTTRVPPFIDVGDVVRVNTEDGSYMSRAK
ncbi:MAG: elongation factor P [Planctomycetes bacterium RBG_16_55_9]|nr:MAG: elongation factor P [Planctomycetes bacterium RBG_16_55_9]